MIKIDCDNEKIEEILSRSIDVIYPNKESLRDLLLSGKQLTIYVGIDPTANYVHLGHSTNYLILERLHLLGHKIIVLVGDFTAMIGDPSDKASARTQLSKQDVVQNLSSFKEQIGKILNFADTNNPIEFKFNSEWLSNLSLEKVIELGSNFTVQQMLKRSMFEKRIAENKPLYINEFFYPLMQGYDSVALNVDLEIGGTDQIFNMLAGRLLARRYLDKEKYIIATTLLTNPITGDKLMSKSLGTGIALNEKSENMFGKIMALPDEIIMQMFIDCTRVSLSEIENKKKRLQSGNPKIIKLELAQEIVGMYHGHDSGNKAKTVWEKTFSDKEIPKLIPELKVKIGSHLIDVLVSQKIVESKNQARRLFEDGAVKNTVNNKKITDPLTIFENSITLKIGKKIFIKLIS